jgi:hypothetical protein
MQKTTQKTAFTFRAGFRDGNKPTVRVQQSHPARRRQTFIVFEMR